MFAVNRTAVNVAMDPHEPPPNFAFLEILAEFSAKLMKQDKKTARKALACYYTNRDSNKSPLTYAFAYLLCYAGST